MKISVMMLNSEPSKLDQILNVGKVIGDHVGLGYRGENSGLKTLFVQASKSKKSEVVQKASGTSSGPRSRPSRKKVGSDVSLL